jgi:hypothetical protein
MWGVTVSAQCSRVVLLQHRLAYSCRECIRQQSRIRKYKEKHMNTKRFVAVLLALMLLPTLVIAQTATATIRVVKTFNGSPPLEATVQLDCNDGHDSYQEKSGLADGDHHNFVITNFTAGEMDCVVTETILPGRIGRFETDCQTSGEGAEAWDCDSKHDQYFPESYWNYEEERSEPELTTKGKCDYVDIEHGVTLECRIENFLMAHRVDVQKHWIDEHPEFNNATYAGGKLECDTFIPNCRRGDDFQQVSGTRQGKNASWLKWDGQDDWDSAYVCPTTSGTSCWVTEKIQDSSVEADTGECSGSKGTPLYTIFPGDWDNQCTVVNTRIYEGVPTLSQYGLVILAMLMLGVGMVGFRRFA